MLFILLLTGLISCTSDPREEIINAYEFQKDSSYVFKIKGLVDLESITGEDSVAILNKNFVAKKDSVLGSRIETLRFWEDKLDNLINADKSWSYIGLINRQIEETSKAHIQELTDEIEVYKSDCKGTFLEVEYNNIQSYSNIKDSVLARRIQCSYISSDGVKASRIYIFSPNFDRILAEVSD